MVAMNMRGALVLLVALSVTGITGAFAVAAPAQKAASSKPDRAIQAPKRRSQRWSTPCGTISLVPYRRC